MKRACRKDCVQNGKSKRQMPRRKKRKKRTHETEADHKLREQAKQRARLGAGSADRLKKSRKAAAASRRNAAVRH